MSLVPLVGEFEFPPIPLGATAAGPSVATSLINASGEKVALICRPPKAGNIRKVLFSVRVVTTGGTLDVRIETVDLTTGFPTGTLFGTNTNGAQVVGGTDDNKIFATTLTADATVTRSSLIALVIVAGSPGDMEIASTNWNNHVFPYGAQNLGAGYSIFGANVTLAALEYDDGSIVPIAGVVTPVMGAAGTGYTQSAFGTGSTPDVVGARFQVPFTVRAVGAWAWMAFGGTGNVRLVSTAYNQGAATGILASAAFDPDVRRGSTGVMQLYFDALVTLSPGVWYRLVVEPDTATVVAMYDAEVGTLNQLNAHPGGEQFHLTSAKDPTGDGSWTNYNSGTFRYPLLGLLIDAVDTLGVSGNGQSAHVYVG